MVFNGEVNGEDLCTLADDLNDSNDTNYPLARKARNANWAMREIWVWIFSVYGGWIYDDKNQTDLPEGTGTLTANQRFYSLPVEEQALAGVDVKDSGGNWNKLRKITLEDIQTRGYSEEEFEDISGNPRYYRPLANGFKIYPASDTTRSTGIKVYIMRGFVSFTPATTSTSPGFDTLFHPAVAVFMALQQAIRKRLATRIDLQKQWDGDYDRTGQEGGYRQKIKEHYKSKFRQNPAVIGVVSSSGPSLADQMY